MDSLVTSETCCEHRRYVTDCGECLRPDLEIGQTVKCADDGTGLTTTWFDGIVRGRESGRILAEVEPFGVGVWDKIAARYIPKTEPPVPAAPAPVPRMKPKVVEEPVENPLRISSVVFVTNNLNDIRQSFEKKGWRASHAVLAQSGKRAVVSNADFKDKTFQLEFTDAVVKGQWWPGELLTEAPTKFAEIDANHEPKETPLPEPTPTPIPEPEESTVEKVETKTLPQSDYVDPVRPETRLAVSKALEAGDAAVAIYTADDNSITLCGHGNPILECGKCPRFDLNIGDKIRAAEAKTYVWFSGIVKSKHEFGYPLVNVEGFTEEIWDKIKLEEVKKTEDDEGCPHKRPLHMCGRCVREDLHFNDEVRVSTDGNTWTLGKVVGKNQRGQLKVALHGLSAGFGYEFIGPKEPKVVEQPLPSTTKRCKVHDRLIDVCGQCIRIDLKRGMRVKVSMDGGGQDSAVFDGIVSSSNHLGVSVSVPSFGDMSWDRVWSAEYSRKLDYTFYLPPRKDKEQQDEQLKEEGPPPFSVADVTAGDIINKQTSIPSTPTEGLIAPAKVSGVGIGGPGSSLIAELQAKQSSTPAGSGDKVKNSSGTPTGSPNDGLIAPAKVTGIGMGGPGSSLLAELQSKQKRSSEMGSKPCTPAQNSLTPTSSPQPIVSSTPTTPNDGLIAPAKVTGVGMGGPGSSLLAELQSRQKKSSAPPSPATDKPLSQGIISPDQHITTPTSSPLQSEVVDSARTGTPNDGLIAPAKVTGVGMGGPGSSLLAELQSKQQKQSSEMGSKPSTPAQNSLTPTSPPQPIVSDDKVNTSTTPNDAPAEVTRQSGSSAPPSPAVNELVTEGSKPVTPSLTPTSTSLVVSEDKVQINTITSSNELITTTVIDHHQSVKLDGSVPPSPANDGLDVQKTSTPLVESISSPSALVTSSETATPVEQPSQSPATTPPTKGLPVEVLSSSMPIIKKKPKKGGRRAPTAVCSLFFVGKKKKRKFSSPFTHKIKLINRHHCLKKPDCKHSCDVFAFQASIALRVF